MPTFYVYGSKKGKPEVEDRYLGYVKHPSPNEAMAEAMRRWPDRMLTLINKKYIVDKKRGTRGAPQEEKDRVRELRRQNQARRRAQAR